MEVPSPPSTSSFPHQNPNPSRIPGDTVFYAFYPDLPSSASSDEISSTLRSLQLEAIPSLLSPYLDSYIWQHDPFHLSLPPNPNPKSPTPCPICNAPPVPHLHGKTRFGDNLDDEWFIVFLLYQISRAVPSLSIRVWDSDGEFLLIEAAFSLPKWINPDNSLNRVFIRHGELHIIPKTLFPSTPTLGDALPAVRNQELNTRASDSVQNVINRRISEFPEKARTNMHRVRALVPLPVAQVLKHEPCLISLAVEGFYDRDVDSMKFASRMERFSRSGGGEVEMVRVSVRMSRAMYGQLVQQNFQAPRCYPMPPREEGPVRFAEAELGMKIAVGFEMMYQERRRDGEEGRGGAWDAFRQSLERSGCFEGLLPGSKEYQRIMNGALEYYRNNSLCSRTREIMNAPVRRIDEILAIPCSVNDFDGIDLPPSDDDSWLYNGEDELNSLMLERQKEMEVYESEHENNRSREQKVTSKSSDSYSDDFNLKDVAESMQAFVQKVSSFAGAEVPQDRTSKAVELDAERFMKDMESVLGPVRGEGARDDAYFEGNSSSSDMDFDDSGDESDLYEQLENDDSRDSFMKSYSDALNEELYATTLKKSFIQANRLSNSNDEGTSTTGMDMDEDLTPVDVDVNLVKSFLDSFSSQQGLPGPASNLLGLMGLKVPPDGKEK